MATWTRRQLAGALALGVGLATGSRARARGPGKLLMIGDSMIAGAFGLFLQRDLEELGVLVDRRGKSSTGLARPDFHDWISLGAKARDAAQPHAVLCMFGGNDGQGLHMGRRADPKWIRYGEDEWTPEYRRRVNRFADAVTAGGERLFWIGMPQMRLTRLHERVAHMNTIYRAEMAIRPNARFVDIWTVLADDDGDYSDRVVIDGKRTRVRTGDGVHLTGAGAQLLADFVRPRLSEYLLD